MQPACLTHGDFRMGCHPGQQPVRISGKIHVILLGCGASRMDESCGCSVEQTRCEIRLWSIDVSCRLVARQRGGDRVHSDRNGRMTWVVAGPPQMRQGTKLTRPTDQTKALEGTALESGVSSGWRSSGDLPACVFYIPGAMTGYFCLLQEGWRGSPPCGPGK